MALALVTAIATGACTNNTDDATNSAGTEEHGTVDQQIDSARNNAAAPNSPGVQPVDTPQTVGP